MTKIEDYLEGAIQEDRRQLQRPTCYLNLAKLNYRLYGYPL